MPERVERQLETFDAATDFLVEALGQEGTEDTRSVRRRAKCLPKKVYAAVPQRGRARRAQPPSPASQPSLIHALRAATPARSTRCVSMGGIWMPCGPCRRRRHGSRRGSTRSSCLCCRRGGGTWYRLPGMLKFWSSARSSRSCTCGRLDARERVHVEAHEEARGFASPPRGCGTPSRSSCADRRAPQPRWDRRDRDGCGRRRGDEGPSVSSDMIVMPVGPRASTAPLPRNRGRRPCGRCGNRRTRPGWGSVRRCRPRRA